MRGRSRGSAIKLAFLIFLAGTAHAQDAGPPSAAAPLRVLFIGNSLTYTNDLPQLVARLSQQSPTGRTIEAAEVTYPSWRLSRHWQPLLLVLKPPSLELRDSAPMPPADAPARSIT